MTGSDAPRFEPPARKRSHRPVVVTDELHGALLGWLAQGCSLRQAAAMELARDRPRQKRSWWWPFGGGADREAEQHLLEALAGQGHGELLKAKQVPAPLLAWADAPPEAGDAAVRALELLTRLQHRVRQAEFRAREQSWSSGTSLAVLAVLPLALWGILTYISPSYLGLAGEGFVRFLQAGNLTAPTMLPARSTLQFYSLTLLWELAVLATFAAVPCWWLLRRFRRMPDERLRAAEAAAFVLLELRQGDELPLAASSTAWVLGPGHPAHAVLSALALGDASRFQYEGEWLAEAAGLTVEGTRSSDVADWLERRLLQETEEIVAKVLAGSRLRQVLDAFIGAALFGITLAIVMLAWLGVLGCLAAIRAG